MVETKGREINEEEARKGQRIHRRFAARRNFFFVNPKNSTKWNVRFVLDVCFGSLIRIIRVHYV